MIHVDQSITLIQAERVDVIFHRFDAIETPGVVGKGLD
jgi:hypothetical protein